MKFQLFKRIVAEDFDQKDQTLIGKIAAIYNVMVDQLNTGLHNNIDFNNLNQEVVTFTVKVDGNGKPSTALILTSRLKSAVQGILVINAINTSNSSPLTGAPFVSFTRSSGALTINQITGLVVGATYNVTVILIG